METNKKKIKFNAFAVQLKECVSKQLGEEYEIYIHTVTKNNGGIKEGIVIRKKEEKITHSIYLEKYYTKYLKGTEFEDIVLEFNQAYKQASVSNLPEAEVLEDFKSVRKNIFFKLVNHQKNEEILSEVPFLPFLDLAITFHCLVQNKKDYISSLRVTNRHLGLWDINTRILTEVAKENTPRIFPATIKTMEEILTGSEMCNIEFDCISGSSQCMYVVSNASGINGATSLLYKAVMKTLADGLKSNFYILPSSIHEIIVIKEDGHIEQEDLAKMVKEVNLTQVAEEDFLSDSVYYYVIEEEKIIKVK